MAADPPGSAIYLAGPTASGKSAVAVHLAARVRGEILSADSMQVYRGMDLGTAKPSLEDRARVPHHLLDLVPATEPFDAARWLQAARRCHEEICVRGHRPIFCGGTGLYFRAWLWGLDPVPPDPNLRLALEATPVSVLLEELAVRDAETCARIDRNNPRRIVRAVERLRLTGKPLGRPHTASDGMGESRVVVLRRDAADLRRRIDARVDAMFAAGLVEETRTLVASGLEQNRAAMQALGYRQVVDYLRGGGDLAQTVAQVKARTWQFARRQMTWFRHQLPVAWMDVPEEENAESTAARILALLADIASGVNHDASRPPA